MDRKEVRRREIHRVAMAASTGSVLCARGGGRLVIGRIGGDHKLGWTFDA